MTKQIFNQKAWFVDVTRNLASAPKLLEKAFLKKYSTKSYFYSVLKIKMDKIKHVILTFLVFCHLFYCVRASSFQPRCQKYTILFVKGRFVITKLTKEFYRIYVRERQFSKSLYNLFQNDNVDYFNIDVYYENSHFLYVKEDAIFGCLYFEVRNRSCHVLIFFSQVWIRIYFNKFRAIGNGILDRIFDT